MIWGDQFGGLVAMKFAKRFLQSRESSPLVPSKASASQMKDDWQTPGGVVNCSQLLVDSVAHFMMIFVPCKKLKNKTTLNKEKSKPTHPRPLGVDKHDFEPIALLEKHLETYLHVFTWNSQPIVWAKAVFRGRINPWSSPVRGKVC